MSGIKSVITLMCMVLIITGIFSILVPKSNMDKVIKFVITLFFLSGIVIPIAKGQFDFSFEYSDFKLDKVNASVTDNTKNTITILSEKKLENTSKQILNKNNIECKKVDMDIHILEDDSIDITKFKIYLPRTEQINLKKAQDLILKEVGIKPNIEIED